MNEIFSDWEQEYKRDYEVKEFQEINHYWWKNCYDQIEKFILKNIPLEISSKILECGSGSGNSSLRLAHKVKKVTLLDGSKNALNCSKQLAKYYQAENAEFIEGNIFSMPFGNKSFDFCWNVGVIEHYDSVKVKEIIKEMLRVTKAPGYLCIGIPNFNSLAIIKARLLAFKPLNLLTSRMKGYRLKDEKEYDKKDINELLLAVCKENNVKLKNISFGYAGSVLPIETPKFIFRKINSFCSHIFKKHSFLILAIVEIDYQ